mmetsp:Transcript_27081/g.59955  ORF Transcript_27081/g.59955 Transcript_27081/m.59955 type:complete len:453 (+) Transcript_27081:3-1361(+)
MSMSCGSPGYVAPEVIERKPYDCSADIFSAGSVIYTLAFRRLAFHGTTAVSILRRNVKACPPYPQPGQSWVPSSCIDLMKGCMTASSEDRFTIDECLESPFLVGALVPDTTTEHSGGVVSLFGDSTPRGRRLSVTSLPDSPGNVGFGFNLRNAATTASIADDEASPAGSTRNRSRSCAKRGFSWKVLGTPRSGASPSPSPRQAPQPSPQGRPSEAPAGGKRSRASPASTPRTRRVSDAKSDPVPSDVPAPEPPVTPNGGRPKSSGTGLMSNFDGKSIIESARRAIRGKTAVEPAVSQRPASGLPPVARSGRRTKTEVPRASPAGDGPAASNQQPKRKAGNSPLVEDRLAQPVSLPPAAASKQADGKSSGKATPTLAPPTSMTTGKSPRRVFGTPKRTGSSHGAASTGPGSTSRRPSQSARGGDHGGERRHTLRAGAGSLFSRDVRLDPISNR